MNIPQATSRRPAVAIWQVAVCFLVAGLFLYNPFLISHHESSNLAVSHPASHRATVGSSELEQFPHRDGGIMAPLPDLDAAQLAIDLTLLTSPSPQHTVDPEADVSPQTGFSSSLWFRPPPAV
jgi:hypothetical protein